jgi:2-polyprenyl-6-methoxyphenol hydroxylase-like FAD-dependent oxidoreductase
MGTAMSVQASEFAIAIVGAGAAGASLAASLARKGLKTALIDPRSPHERDFRAEKITPAQWEAVGRIGLQEAMRPALTFEPRVWVARRGRLIDKCASGNWNFRYPLLIDALRGAARAEPNVEFIEQRVAEIVPSEGSQQIRLADGRQLTARLVAIATGVGGFLPKELGFERRLVFARHSVSIGFDMAPLGRKKFDFPAVTYHSERASDRLAYLSLFPIGETMRANMFVYRNAADPWLALMQSSPEAALRDIMPGLPRLIGGFLVRDALSLRPVDLYRMERVRRPGVVLIGDCFGTACPASGSGLDKVFSDVARLSAHAPGWLATPGMSAEKIAAFYDDSQKIAADADSLARSRKLREMSTQAALPWRLRRDLRFYAQSARGIFRAAVHA